ncbi:MAG: toll/interleukin-1 receptor domain-containing protein [Anaerolineales bacterium]|nr:toll/interleukin-1 receptor domain-containing protein [Anaerolineales bacterium]
MAHDVFISYSSKDKPIANGVCANLEGAGVRCWIAPRDIAPGEDWPTAIAKAIPQSRIMVLVFSSNSNSSEDVGRELMLAANSKLVIIPFKIENIEPEPGKQYYLARTHWLDAMNPPTKKQIATLVSRVKSILPATDPGNVDGTEPDQELSRVALPKLSSPIRPAWLRYLWIPVMLVILGVLAWIMFIVDLNQHTTTLTRLLTSMATVSTHPMNNDQVIPTSKSQYIFQDDFSDETSGWDISTDQVAERYYENGEYIIRILPGYTSNYSNSWSVADVKDLGNVTIEVDARFVSGEGAYGIIVNYLSDQYFNFIEITPDGYWDLVQKSGGYYSDLVLFQPSSVIRTGTSTNRLRIELSESSVLYVNDQFISNLAIPHMVSGVGLWATAWSGSGFEVAFDNLVITQLP